MPYLGDEFERYNVIPIILVIDTSGNGSVATAELNETMAGLYDVVADFTQKHDFYQVKLSVITYSSDVKILLDNVYSEDFYWKPITTAGLSDLGNGLKKLPEIVRNTRSYGYYNTQLLNPIILFIAKNYPTDNYEKQVSLLKKHDWFKYAEKIAFNYGGDYDATEFFCEITGDKETSNIPISNFHECVQSILQGVFQKYDDRTIDVIQKDLLKIDPIGKLPEYQILLCEKQMNIDEPLSIVRCQIAPCELAESKNEVFTICEHDGIIAITNRGFKCYAELCVAASTSRTFNGFLNKKMQIISQNVTEIEIDTNTEHSSISIKNNGDDVFVRVEFLPDTTVELVDNDRLLDDCNRTILCVRKIYYEEPVIINEPLMGVIEWDNDNPSTENESANPNGGWDDEW